MAGFAFLGSLQAAFMLVTCMACGDVEDSKAQAAFLSQGDASLHRRSPRRSVGEGAGRSGSQKEAMQDASSAKDSLQKGTEGGELPREGHALDAVYAPQHAPQNPVAWPMLPAFVPDEMVPAQPIDPRPRAGDVARVRARRAVYRLTYRPVHPDWTRSRDKRSLTTELEVLTSDDRLRASFVGKGWPVETGAEVRLREDMPGVYVFDSAGGRPLAPGRLHDWFLGARHQPRSSSGVERVVVTTSLDAGERDTVPKQRHLMCALLSEWSGQSRAALRARCHEDAPLRFVIGPWRAERTAEVAVSLRPDQLVADQRFPPSRPQTWVAQWLWGVAAGASAEGIPWRNPHGVVLYVRTQAGALGFVPPGGTLLRKGGVEGKVATMGGFDAFGRAWH